MTKPKYDYSDTPDTMFYVLFKGGIELGFDDYESAKKMSKSPNAIKMYTEHKSGQMELKI